MEFLERSEEQTYTTGVAQAGYGHRLVYSPVSLYMGAAQSLREKKLPNDGREHICISGRKFLRGMEVTQKSRTEGGSNQSNQEDVNMQGRFGISSAREYADVN